MAHDEAELAELRRRAYGPGADLASDPAAMARLAAFENARRPAAADPGGAPERDAAGGAGGDPSEPEVPGQGERGKQGERSGADAPEADGVRVRPRWFSPALVATSGIAAVIIMLVAGGVGWSGGFIAGWAGASSPADHDLTLEEILKPQELAGELSEDPWLASIRDPRTGELRDGDNYYGEFVDGLHMTVTTSWWGPEDDSPSERACLQLMEVVSEDQDGQSARGFGACGSLRLGFSADLIVGDDTADGFQDLPVSGYAAGSVLRFVYDDATGTVEVWSLPPATETDPDV